MYTWLKNRLSCLWFGHDSYTKPKWFKIEHSADCGGAFVDVWDTYHKMSFCKKCGSSKRVEYRGRFDNVPVGAIKR